jgi:flagellar hook-associated protein 3 FlgL
VTRITNSMTTRTVLYDLENAYNQMNETQTQLSSGVDLTKPSDNPFGVSQALSVKSDLASNAQYQSNVSNSTAWLSATDTALSSLNNDLATARDLVVQGSNGALSQSDLNAIADQLDQLADSVKSEGNTQYAGSYIFAGTATETQPFTVGGTDTYAGNSSTISREIGQNVSMTVNVTGDTVISPILAAIRQAAVDLRAGGTPGNLGTTDLNALDAAADTLSQTQATVGASENRLTSAASRLQQLQQAQTQQLSDVQDTDVAQAMINFSQESSVYQAALRAGASLIQPSLMDFLSTS